MSTMAMDAAFAYSPVDVGVALRKVGRMLRTVMIATVIVLVVGNLAILAATSWARHGAAAAQVPSVPAGVHNFRAVDDTLLRGSAPSAQSYRDLAAMGVRTVVDLRAEAHVNVDQALLDSLDIDLVQIPIRDGQTPTPEMVRRFLTAIDSSAGRVYVHCGAGIGRTGSMVAAYNVERRGLSGVDAARHNLSVGPPSLEQIAYATRMNAEFARPNGALVAVSRVLDAPRRTWARLTKPA